MLVPLNRYFQTLIPTLGATSSSRAPSPIPAGVAASVKPFSLPAFLTHLRNTGPNPLTFRTKGLSTKSRVESDFYAAFCMSPTFAGWLHAKLRSLEPVVAAAANAAVSAGTDGLLGVPIPMPGDISSASTPSQEQAETPRRGLGIAGHQTSAVPATIHVEHRSGRSSETDERDSDATRPSTESSPVIDRWRASEEAARAPSPSVMDIYNRRGSDGVLRGLPLNGSPRRTPQRL